MVQVRYHSGYETLTATQARRDLFSLVRQVNDNDEAVIIQYRGGTAVLIGMKQWNTIEEAETEKF